MKRKLEISELIFKILSYLFLTIFALMCLYPFIYAIAASVSGRHAVEYGQVVLLPKDIRSSTRRGMRFRSLRRYGRMYMWQALQRKTASS